MVLEFLWDTQMTKCRAIGPDRSAASDENMQGSGGGNAQRACFSGRVCPRCHNIAPFHH